MPVRSQILRQVNMSKLLLIIGLYTLTVPAAFGWNHTGHRIVAEIAWRDLSGSKRAAIARLLNEHPHYRLLLATNVPEDCSTNEWTFLNCAVWPDMVRSARGDQEKPADITKYHRSPWHYINLPYVLPKDAGKISVSNFTINPTNILWALSNNIAVLQNKRLSAEERAVALCWVAHLVGDLHQPLHAATLLSEVFPRGDQGGNLLGVADTSDVPLNLHSYWDQIMGSADAYDAVAMLSDSIANARQNQPSNLWEYRKNKTIGSWADESYGAAVSFAYCEGGLKFANWRSLDSGGGRSADVPKLRASYILNADVVARRRLALAGHRLADVIKQSL